LGDLEVDIEDTAVTSLACIVNGRPVAIQVHQSFVQRPRSRTTVVTGTNGAIHLDLMAPRLTQTDAGGHLVRQETFDGFHRNQLFVDELKAFLAGIAGGASPAASIREAARSLRIALAARESLRTNQAVPLI
jgi:predicted dehydrogenase